MNDFVNIKIKDDLNDNNQSPIIKGLLIKDNNLNSFKNILNDDEKTNRIVELRKELYDGSLSNDEIVLVCKLLGHLISAKFSGKSQSIDAIAWTLKRLINGFKEKKELVFTYCFGGYKNYHSPSFPEVDFAEIFNLNFMISYLYPLIKFYPYGVVLEYESEEISIQFNNVPQDTTDRYTNTFQKLITWYINEVKNKYNLTIDIRLVIARTLYKNDEELYRLIEEKKSIYLEYFENLSNEEKEKWIQRAESNFMLNGIVNYTNANNEEKYNLLKLARIRNEAFLDADYILRESWFNQDNRIPITGTWGIMPSASPIDGWLHIKSNSSSRTDFWIGTGILEKKKDEYIECILSFSNFEAIKNELEYFEVTNKELINISENFKHIGIVCRGGLSI